MQFHAATALVNISSNTLRASSSWWAAAYTPTRLVITCPLSPVGASILLASARAWRARLWGSAPTPVGAIAARRVEKENTLGRSPWQPTRREKNASRAPGVAPDAAGDAKEEVGEGGGRRGVGYGEEEERLCAGEIGDGGEGEKLHELKYSRGFSFICAIGRIDPATQLMEI